MPDSSLPSRIKTESELRQAVVSNLHHLPLEAAQRFKLVEPIVKNLNRLLKKNGTIAGNSPLLDFIGKAQAVVDRFHDQGLTLTGYLGKAALKHPALLTRSPVTIAANINGVIDRLSEFELTLDDYLKAALKQPQLFAQSPDTIAANVTGVIHHFLEQGLSPSAYLKAALKEPSLFARSPKTVIANISGVVDHFREQGLPMSAYLKAAQDRPQLFYQSPQTIIEHIELAAQLYEMGAIKLKIKKYGTPDAPGDRKPLLRWLCDNADQMCMGTDNFLLRMAHFELLGRPSRNLLEIPRRDIEQQVAQALGHSDMTMPVSRTGYDPKADYNYGRPEERHGVLCSLIEQGCIKSLKFTPK